MRQLPGGLLGLALCFSSCGSEGDTAPSPVDAIELPPLVGSSDGAPAPSEFQQRVAQGQQFLQARRLLFARKAFQEALVLEPRSVPILLLHARLCLNLGDPESLRTANENLGTVLEQDPANLDALAALASVICERSAPEDFAKVVNSFDAAVKSGAQPSPEQSREVILARGKAALVAGEPQGALERFDEALAIEDADHEARFYRALALEGLAELEEAEAEAARLVEANPERPANYQLRSRLLNLLGREEEARHDADLFAKLSRLNDPDLKDADRITALKELVTLLPRSRRLPFDLARAHLTVGQGKEAEAIARRFLGESQSDGEAYFILAQSLAAQGDEQGALAAARELANSGLVTQPVIDDLVRRLGELLRKQG